jgi:hypothetical protein
MDEGVIQEVIDGLAERLPVFERITDLGNR